MNHIDQSRYIFRTTFQSRRENFDSYFMKLKRRLDDCVYADPDSELRAQLILGSEEIRSRAFCQSMTLDDIISFARFAEKKCTRCGLPGHKYFSKMCRAKNKVCRLCSECGHYEFMCHNQKSFARLDSEPEYGESSRRSSKSSLDGLKRPGNSSGITKRKSTNEDDRSLPAKKLVLTVADKTPADVLVKQEPEGLPDIKPDITQYFFGSIGGVPVKIHVNKSQLANVVCEALFTKLYENKCSVFTSDNIPLKIGEKEFIGQFTSYIELNSKSSYASFLIQQGSSETLELSEKLAQHFGLV